MKENEKDVTDAAKDILEDEAYSHSIYVESSDWVDDLKNGDLLYTAEYERDKEDNESIKVLTLKFKEYDMSAVTDKNSRMAILAPVVNGKELETVKIASQNVRVGYFPTKAKAVRAFQEMLEHMASLARETADRLEVEENPHKIKMN